MGYCLHKYSSFFNGARSFFVSATEYLLKWCPMKEDILKHATRIDFENRLEKSSCSVEYFIHHYHKSFTSVDIDKLIKQFWNYQLLITSDILTFVKQLAGLDESY